MTKYDSSKPDNTKAPRGLIGGCPASGSVASIQMPDGQPLTAEISCRPRELRSGSMYRSALAQDRGMPFVYQNPGLHQHLDAPLLHSS
jgi:hypothetical protein